VSPFLKNLCYYIYNRLNQKVELFCDFYNKEVPLEGIELVQMDKISKEKYIFGFIRNKYYEKRKLNSFIGCLKNKLDKYKIIFAVDFLALDIIYKSGYNLSNVVFLSLEGGNYFKNYDSEYILLLIKACRERIIADKDRESDLKMLLNDETLKFKHIPVSLYYRKPPLKLLDSDNSNNEIKLIYSGYFADWGCVKEVVDIYISSGINYPFLLQGHSWGTEEYLASIKKITSFKDNIEIDTNFYDDNEYSQKLSKYDIGFACYKDVNNDGNFSNIIYSSGKIANYLWNGLAVITNIDSQLTRKPPFILIKNDPVKDFLKGLELYKINKNNYIKAAYKTANKYYNINNYGSIMDALLLN